MYHVNGYSTSSSQPEHVCAFRELDRCKIEAERYANRRPGKNYALVQDETQNFKTVYDTRDGSIVAQDHGRCDACRFDIEPGAFAVLRHGRQFCGWSCLCAWEQQNHTGPRIDVHLYGTNQIGEPERTPEGSWVRYDTYTSNINRHTPRRERHFASGQDDYSPLFAEDWNGSYTSDCSCCYLGFSHTLAAHNEKRSRK